MSSNTNRTEKSAKSKTGVSKNMIFLHRWIKKFSFIFFSDKNIKLKSIFITC